MSLFLFQSGMAQIINFPDPAFKAKLLSSLPTNSVAGIGNDAYIAIDANGNSEIEVSEALAVTKLNVGNSGISSLSGIEYFTNLTLLYCNHNSLATLDVTMMPNLATLHANNNSLASLNIAGLGQLSGIWCYANNLTSLDLTGLVNLKSFLVMNNQLTALNLQGLIDLEGITCTGNQLTSLDISGLPSLTGVNCANNLITSINLSNCPVLEQLDISVNPIASIDLSALPPSFFQLACVNTQLTSLDLSNVNLVTLNCGNSPITSLDVSDSSYLYTLDCTGCQLTSIDVSQNHNLNTLNCGYNLLTTLDVSQNTTLQTLNCKNNLLTSLFVKNGAFEGMEFNNNPTLQYICADEAQFSYIQTRIGIYQYQNCHVNSYCSFVPGGTHYVIQGTGRYDADANGCNANDLAQLPMKFNISNGVTSGNLLPDASGNYEIPVLAGTHTVTPVFENEGYFMVDPASVTVAFPAETSPFQSDFCITANGEHSDLEIIMLPVNPAVPGTDVHYQIKYKNKGTTVQTGSLQLGFDDAILDFVEATPVIGSQAANLLTWAFADLNPFETRTINVTLNVNSPIETPAVNAGNVLVLAAAITGNANEETADDNQFSLNQTVVNSFDPNDKTCLEGTTVGPEMAGQYVHYQIRFENTGTSFAQNIVVKDMIDTTKFDIASLIPLDGSHNYYTRISGNKVEFIFVNINLPFDHANNDGYVMFKIKTKPTLVLGDTFSNTASIYFDYNHPIVTDPAVTTISVLGNKDFEFTDYFSVHPNPAKTTLNIESKSQMEIESLSIYNLSGQLVVQIPTANGIKNIDVSNLKPGIYFLRIDSDQGVSNTKFIKR